MFKVWQNPTLGPIKIQEGKKRGTNEIVSKRKKDNKHTHSCKNKTLPQRALMEMHLGFKNQKGVGLSLGRRSRDDGEGWHPHWLHACVCEPCLVLGGKRFCSLLAEGREPISRDGLDPTVCSCG